MTYPMIQQDYNYGLCSHSHSFSVFQAAKQRAEKQASIASAKVSNSQLRRHFMSSSIKMFHQLYTALMN